MEQTLITAAQKLSNTIDILRFAAPITHVYNPLTYAWAVHEQYLRTFAKNKKRVVFVGMNPGPFGMVQTGVPFGEIDAVRAWLGLYAEVKKPATENPKRPIEGFACKRSEVSGHRLWGLFKQRFGTPEHFFAEHFVANYCPLAFFENARNITPDKLPVAEQKFLLEACDKHLRLLVETLQPQWVIGVGAWAEKRAKVALKGMDIKTGRILHPSPASPAANRDWAGEVTQQLQALKIWQVINW